MPALQRYFDHHMYALCHSLGCVCSSHKVTPVQAGNEWQSKEGEDTHHIWHLLLEVRKTQPAREVGGGNGFNSVRGWWAGSGISLHYVTNRGHC